MNQDRLLDLNFWRRLLLRYRWLILGCGAGVGALALSFSLSRDRVYEATCRLYLNPQRVQPLSVEDLYTKQPSRPNDRLLTQVEMVQSKPVLEIAVADLEARGALTFDPSAAHEPASFWGGRGGVAESAEARRAAYVARLQGRVRVGLGAGSGLMSITVRARDPQKAADQANAIGDAYLRRDREMLKKSADEAIAWLSGKLADQKKVLMASEEQLRQFSGSPAPRPEDVGTLAVEELSRLQQQLLDVRMKLLEMESRAAPGGRPGAAVPSGAANDVQAEVGRAMRDRVRKDLVDTSVALSQIRQRYGERHPDVIAMAEKEKQLRDELQRLGPAEPAAPSAAAPAAPGPDDLQALRAQERALRGEFERAIRNSVVRGQDGTRYALLKHEVDVNRALYNEMLARLNEITISAGLDAAAAEVFERARPVAVPIAPNHRRDLVLGLCAGLFLGLLAAVLRDQFDQSVRGPDHANDLLRAPVLGMIPHHGRIAAASPGERVPLWVQARSDSANAESYRILASRIDASLPGEEAKVILMTSAVPGEGKSTTAVNLAAAFAESGRRVLVIDGDLRRPSLDRFFGLDRGRTLARVLSEEMKPEAAVRPTGVPNLDHLGAIPGPPMTDGRRLSAGLRRLFTWAGERYERIVVDMPVVMVVPGVTEASQAGGSILLVHRPGWVPAQVLEQVREHLTLARARLAGAVLNGVRARWLAGRYPVLPYYAASAREAGGRGGERREE